MSVATELIAKEEGFSPIMYEDTLGNITIGHGITTITEEESKAVLALRVEKIEQELRENEIWFHKLNEDRQAVVVSMAYQLGMNGLLKFQKMIAAIVSGDYEKAAEEMLDSKWARQTKERALRAAVVMESGNAVRNR